jgi:acetylornithine deacetylase/succinyl-diaminopimelate desuccinylase-like protein
MDWEKAQQEALDLFQALIRINTENPPGNEMEAMELVASWLKKDSIEATLFETAPQRGNLVARLQGSGNRDDALILTAHLDVVSAKGQKWRYPPFDAQIADGFLWGRGTLDMKNMAAMAVMVLKYLKRNGARLKRDVVFAGVSDEEAGGRQGAAALVEEHASLLAGRDLIGEVGGFNLTVGNAVIVPIQVAEKGRVVLRLRARGPAGHGSLPLQRGAISSLSQAIARLEANRLPHHLTAVTEDFLKKVASVQGRAHSIVLKKLAHPLLAGPIMDWLIRNDAQKTAFEAMLSNTATPTMLRAGEADNVIPQRAEATVDGRFLPGQTADDLISEVAAVVGPDIEIEKVSELPPVETRPYDTALYQCLCRQVAHHAPEPVCVVPNLMPGYTDAKHFSKLGLRCYGFTPTWFEKDSAIVPHRLFHAPDERIPINGFFWGLRVLYDVVEEWCCR